MKALKHPALQIGIAAIAGIVFGLIVGEWAGNLKFIGDIFIRLIQMSIVPLVMASVIVATGSMTGAGTGKLAFRTFKWMIGFSVVAAFIAWGLSVLIQPGAGMVFQRRTRPDAGGIRGGGDRMAGHPSQLRVDEHLLRDVDGDDDSDHRVLAAVRCRAAHATSTSPATVSCSASSTRSSRSC